MKVIYKYPLLLIDKQTVEIPVNTKIINVKNQHGLLVLYGIVDLEYIDEKENVTIYVVGTGHHKEDNFFEKLEFLDTVMFQSGTLMFHIFKEK